MSRFEGTVRAPWGPHVSGMEAEKERSSEMGARKEGCGESSGGVGGEGQMRSREGKHWKLWGGGPCGRHGYKAQSCTGSGTMSAAWDIRGE